MLEDDCEPEVEIIEDEEPDRSFARVFLYPCNAAGLGRIGTVCGLLLALAAVRYLLYSALGPAAVYIMYGLMLVNFLVGADFFFYMTDCIRSSAAGAVRADEEFSAFPDGWSEILEEFGKVIVPYLVCFMPAILYMAYTANSNGLFWGLLAAGVFYFPMFLLAAVLFDSAPGYNPILHLVSIFSTLFSYLLLVLQVLLIVGLFALAAFLFELSPLTAFLVVPLQLYCLLVFAHLLGRFYFLYEEKLRWEV